jgi:hypothetical protein
MKTESGLNSSVIGRNSTKVKKIGILFLLLVLVGVISFTIYKAGSYWLVKNGLLDNNKPRNPWENVYIPDNTQDTLGSFESCLVGENIDVGGFLIEGALERVDKKRDTITFACGDDNITTLKLIDSTRYLVVNRKPSFSQLATRSSQKDYQDQEVSKDVFFKQVKEGDQINVNIYETEDGYTAAYLIK